MTTADVGAQSTDAVAVDAVSGSCSDLGLAVVEPQSVAWQSNTSPILKPSYLWAYGDVDWLWDDSLDDYWFHWYDAVPGPDPFVVYGFEAGTSIEGVEFVTDWSSGDLQLTGLNALGLAPTSTTTIELSKPFEPQIAGLSLSSVSGVKITTSTQNVKLLEVDFCGGGAPDPTPDPTPGPTPDPTPIAECGSAHDPADAYCTSVHVIDSFGDAPLPAGAGTGMQWNTVNDYYDNFGDRAGMCSIDVHNSYWTAVRSADGVLTHYPSWHPPVHDPGGPQECRFTHEHGIDPRTSNLYDEDHPTNIGVPFGFVHPGMGDLSPRVEDHVGHKVVVANDFYLTTSNPYHGSGFTLTLFERNGAPVKCDWYSKLHQGTHSADALGFNLHEYYLNYSCDDGTEVRIKEMTDFGFRSPAEAETPGFPLTAGTGTVGGCGWFATNLPATALDPDPSGDSDFGDAGRGFACLMNDAKIEELWKPSAYLSAPDGAGTLAYDPYYVVMNPNRYALPKWWNFLEQDGDHVGENAMVSMVDFCVEGSELRIELERPGAPSNFVKLGWELTGPFRVGTYCDSIDPAVITQWEQDIVDAGGDSAALAAQRKGSVDNSFLGTRRGVHTKGPVLYGREANFGVVAYFCSDHLGNATWWPTNPNTGAAVTTTTPWSVGDPTPVCQSGVPQLLSTSYNSHGPVEGSTAGSTVTGGGFVSNGPASEITIDMDALYPNHGIQAPN